MPCPSVGLPDAPAPDRRDDQPRLPRAGPRIARAASHPIAPLRLCWVLAIEADHRTAFAVTIGLVAPGQPGDRFMFAVESCWALWRE